MSCEITDKQIAQIEVLAESSTGGEWDYVEHDDCAYLEGPSGEFIGTADHVHDGYWMAAANPARILALISRLRAAERDAARYRWLTDGKRGDYCWNNVLSKEDRGDHDCLDIAIDTAMKGDKQ